MSCVVKRRERRERCCGPKKESFQLIRCALAAVVVPMEVIEPGTEGERGKCDGRVSNIWPFCLVPGQLDARFADVVVLAT